MRKIAVLFISAVTALTSFAPAQAFPAAALKTQTTQSDIVQVGDHAGRTIIRRNHQGNNWDRNRHTGGIATAATIAMAITGTIIAATGTTMPARSSAAWLPAPSSAAPSHRNRAIPMATPTPSPAMRGIARTGLTTTHTSRITDRAASATRR
jgi:hypothetical protein